MKKNIYKKLSDEKLVSRRNTLKGALISLGIVALIAIAILIFLFIFHDFKNFNFITFFPFFGLLSTFLPLIIILGQINNEIKSRNIK